MFRRVESRRSSPEGRAVQRGVDYEDHYRDGDAKPGERRKMATGIKLYPDLLDHYLGAQGRAIVAIETRKN